MPSAEARFPDHRSSRAARIAGVALTTLVILFLIVDAGAKVARVPPAVVQMADLGYPDAAVVLLGVVLLACTLIHVHPRTSVLGAVLLTGYLGGAVATHARTSSPLFSHTLFPVYVGLVLWAGLYLRHSGLREWFPRRR